MACAPVPFAADRMAAMFRYESRAAGGPMHTLSSARYTCSACLSAVEYTATVLMFMARHARMMRTAISPRLAMRIFSNMSAPAP